MKIKAYLKDVQFTTMNTRLLLTSVARICYAASALN